MKTLKYYFPSNQRPPRILKNVFLQLICSRDSLKIAKLTIFWVLLARIKALVFTKNLKRIGWVYVVSSHLETLQNLEFSYNLQI